MRKWALLILFLGLAGLAIYCAMVSRAAFKVVTAVEGPPVLEAEVDFSRAFTNEFAFRHSTQPVYGLMFLTLQVEPWPADWKDSEDASEYMRLMNGKLRVFSVDGKVAEERELDWFYNGAHNGMSEHKAPSAPVQGFWGRLPLGDYRLMIATTEGVPKLKGTKQKLLLRYDYIHERPIAKFFRGLGIVFAAGAVLVGYAVRRVWIRKGG